MMKLRYLWVPFIMIVLTLSACKDKEIPIETTSDDTADQDQATDLGNVDKEIKKYRGKADKYLSIDIDDVMKHQNQAMQAVKKAQNMDVGEEQYKVFVNEAIPNAKKAAKEAESLQSESNPKDLDKLQDKFVTPLDTFVKLLERKADSLVADTQQKKDQLRKEYKKYAKQYVNELSTFYDQLQTVADKYQIDLNWDDVKPLKEQINDLLDIANFLHMADDHLEEFISFHENAIDKLHDLIENSETTPDPDSIQKIKEDLFSDFDHLFQGDWDEQLDRKQTEESVDQLKKTVNEQLDALKEHKQGIDHDKKKRMEKARNKNKQSKKDMEQLHDHLQDFKLELEKNK